ncbi:Trafficking protein particle complex subunit 11 [Arabidopsis thaliana x Arabidopsis arenosa]|uniref:Trafficking protein particle complex subunit 11 n=1 Tax=Arabidopsis thaliana x Arabidopsis arenosa TaxID=1240361 RepID=A0A8T1XU62_9BRAS|nr:Trafficking protein particle complex subunit 11 [Arabidopsis thaliana x Arabidopsis arenosa]
MEEYPEELRTPPVSLVALFGYSELHASITKYLHSQQPPINALAFPDFSHISLLLAHDDQISRTSSFRDPLSVTDSSSPIPSRCGGILKRDWLLKHRTKVPALVAAFFPSHHIFGDPTQWLQVCSDLDSLKSVIRPKNIKLVVVVVQSSPHEEISEDRLVALRKRAELDSKYVLFFNSSIDSELTHSLSRLASAFAELALAYYREEGRRIKSRVEKKSSNSLDLNVRYCFKVAVYAEFRRDWGEALKFYEDAYHSLHEMIGTSTRLPAIQRLVEIKIIAEQLHFKISTLLLHGGKLIEAVTWFHQHKASYEKVVGSTDFIFLHWDWMSRQFLVFAELLETSSATGQSFSSSNQGTAEISLTEFEFYPAYYYQLAAHYLKDKKSALELLLSMSEIAQEIDTSSASITPSVYVGQFAQLLEKGETLTLHSITDEEYTRYTISEAKRFQDSLEIIDWLKRSYESFTNLKARRMAALCAFELAREYFDSADPSNAKFFFDISANLYRQEGWVTLLWEVLGYLRECSRNLGALKDFVEFSLEMVALPVTSYDNSGNLRNKNYGPGGPATISGRESIHREVFTLVCREAEPLSSTEGSGFKLATDSPLHLDIDLVSPLRPVLLASVAFHEQMIKPRTLCSFTLSLLSHLPLPVEIDHLEVQFNQSTCNFVIRNSQRPLWASASNTVKSGSQVENEPSLVLVPNNWLRLTYAINSEQSGKLECLSVLAKLGPLFTICSRAESPAAMEDLPVWKHENSVESLPTKDPVLAVFGQKATQIDEPEPQVDVSLGASGPALVGEDFTMPIVVTSKGHAVYSGELKINLVDVGGGGLFSPREAEPFSLESHHVEICGIDGAEGNDESESETGSIKKIQQSFGLVSVPDLKEGESWSCKLEIKWHRPKPVMLFVSLGYLPHGSEANTQKLHIHKSLQIEGKMPLLISNRFMLPYRRDHLLLNRIKPAPDSEDMSSLPLNEKSVLVVSAKNCSEIALELVSMSIEFDDELGETSCLIQQGSGCGDSPSSANLAPGEEFKKVFTVIPTTRTPKLGLGSVHLKWRRQGGNITEAYVSTKQKLPEVNVEASPLVMSLNSPPYAILGEPFTYAVRICNKTQLLQEAKFALADAQSFVLSGSHSNTVSVLPKSEHVLSYKLVPLTCGEQQLPKITVTSARYSAEFQPSAVASSVFVFPSAPQAEKANSTTK